MKRKNNYIWICAVWIAFTLLNVVLCVVNFVDGNLWQGVLNLAVSVGFSFVSGILLEKAFAIHIHNKECDWLHEIVEELKAEAIESIQPFEEFEE
jgi:hypothetical protein